MYSITTAVWCDGLLSFSEKFEVLVCSCWLSSNKFLNGCNRVTPRFFEKRISKIFIVIACFSQFFWSARILCCWKSHIRRTSQRLGTWWHAQGLQQPMVSPSPMPPLGQAWTEPGFRRIWGRNSHFWGVLPRSNAWGTKNGKKWGWFVLFFHKKAVGSVVNQRISDFARNLTHLLMALVQSLLLFLWRFGWTPRLKKRIFFILELESTEPSMLLWCDSDSKSPTIHGPRFVDQYACWKETNERTKGRMGLVVLGEYPIMITIM